jgi:hypothetical protein
MIMTVIFPYVQLPYDTTIYTDQSIVLDAGAGYSYLWSTGETTQTITVHGAVAGPGVHPYSVTVTNSGLCSAGDTINISVTLPPRDLIVESAVMVPSSIPANGDSTDLQSVITNTGTISAVASVVNYYLSADPVLSQDDLLLGSGIVSALPPGVSQPVVTRVSIPQGYNGLMQYVIFDADGSGLVVESNEGNNSFPLVFYYGPANIPVNVTVSNHTVTNGQVRCFNALNTITVAGSGTTFQVAGGGSATFIAGVRIRFLPGVKVYSGGYLHGFIEPGGQYCYTAPVSKLYVSDDSTLVTQENSGNISVSRNGTCLIYPNPTKGEFTLSVLEDLYQWPVKAQIFNAFGILIKESFLEKGAKHKFNLSDSAPGVYFLVIHHGGQTEVLKIIRY